MAEAHRDAARVLGVTVRGPRVWGWRGRTLGRRAVHPEYGACWLRVLCAPAEKAGGKLWEGTERAAVAFPTVRKPQLFGVRDWLDTAHGCRYRAELTRFVDEPVLSAEPVLRQETDLPDGWFTAVRETLSTVAATRTDRIAVRQEWIDRAVPRFTGHPAPHVEDWECAHGDFHAANLTTGATVLDWEGWGMAPRGYDVALLVAYSQLAPRTAARMRQEFRDLLDTAAGRAATLVVCADLLQSASRGDHPDLTGKLHRLVERAARQE
ncbi:phosphotransferase [Streptomyces sp. NPDC086091]|uniref:phosphotransferase n=1 Tax=Streptomyces sp. NPDC086091 TaxID=3365751 RepID=UPI00381AF85F